MAGERKDGLGNCYMLLSGFSPALRRLLPGLFFILLDLLRFKDLATKLEDLWGGRVGVLIPTNPRETDPVVLFAHHRHSFWPLDPFRPLLRLFLEEGFPAHPHRGFQTVTYVMKVCMRYCVFFHSSLLEPVNVKRAAGFVERQRN